MSCDSPFSESPTDVVVMGPFRSGTSLVMQVLHGVGVDVGPGHALFPANRKNLGGCFQRPDVRNANTAFIETAAGTLSHPLDPVSLSKLGNAEVLQQVDLSWGTRSRVRAIKDPRFCATLFSWLEADILSRERLGIVWVRRSQEHVARSAVRHFDVRTFCNSDLQEARRMTRRYDNMARWHAERLGVPVCELHYEQMLADPDAMVMRLANFVGVNDPALLRRGRRVVGKSRAVVRYYVDRLRASFGR